jgi:hypothetical protein
MQNVDGQKLHEPEPEILETAFADLTVRVLGIALQYTDVLPPDAFINTERPFGVQNWRRQKMLSSLQIAH